MALTGFGVVMLLSAALHDVAVRTVPNTVALLLLICGVFLRLMAGDIVTALMASGAVFVVTFLFWRLGWMGGGDLKLLTAAAMFVVPAKVPTLIIVTSLAGGILAMIFLIGGAIAPPPAKIRPAGLLARAVRAELWRLKRRGPLPYATAIAAGGLYATLVQLSP